MKFAAAEIQQIQDAGYVLAANTQSDGGRLGVNAIGLEHSIDTIRSLAMA